MLPWQVAFLSTQGGAAGTMPTFGSVVFDTVSPFSVTLPAAIESGDLLIAFQYASLDTPGAHAEPTGVDFTAASFGPDFQNNGTSTTRDGQLTCWTRICDGSEDSATVSFSETGSHLCGVLHVQDQDPSTPIESAAVTSDNTTADISVPTVTATQDNSLALLIAGYSNDIGYPASLTGGSGSDYTLEDSAATASGGDRAVAIYTAPISSAGSISGKSGTVTSVTSDAHIQRAFVLRPS